MTYDPLDPLVREDPYPSYATLRREAPVYRYAPVRMWVLSRYVDITAALTRPPVRSSADARSHDRSREPDG